MKSFCIAAFTALIFSGCDTMRGAGYKSNSFPDGKDLTCVEDAIRSSPSVTFKERKKIEGGDQFVYRINSLEPDLNHAAVKVTGRGYSNQYFSINKPVPQERLAKAKHALTEVNSSIVAGCNVKIDMDSWER